MTDWDLVHEIWEKNNKPSSYKLQTILAALGMDVDDGHIRRSIRKWRDEEYQEAVETAKATKSDIGSYLWDRLKEESQKRAVYLQEHRPSVITLKTDKPIAVAFIADQHFGNYHVDYERAENDAKAVGTTNGVYAILGGDGVDNFVKTTIASAMLQAPTTPRDQLKILEYYLSIFNGKILALVSGNHELWASELVGIDIYKHVIDKGLVPTINNSFTARVILYVNDIEYRIMIRHKYRYNSSFNITHTVKRMWEMGDFDFDIGVVCHQHEAAYEPFYKHGQQKWAVRTGTYKTYDTFADKIGFNGLLHNTILPVAVLQHDKKQIDMVSTIDSAKKLIGNY